MMKKDWKKQLKRVKDIADKNFIRNEKPEQLNDSLIKLETRVDQIKQTCHSVGKKLLACLQLHGIEQEKRLKKLPESALSKQMIESSSQFEDGDAVRLTLNLCGRVEDDLAFQLMNYEDSVEANVLQPLQNLLEKDIPNIAKLRKQVTKQAQEVDALKNRLGGMSRQTVLDKPSDGSKKLNQVTEDMEDATNKLELYKDQLATELYNFRAREGELNKIFIALIDSQLKYHTRAAAALREALPEVEVIDQTTHRPVYGCSLEDHLRQTNKQLATVINDCISTLYQEGLQQEGLFRIACGTTKLKKLKAAFDAGMVEMDEYSTDPHCIAGALKLYLRELPEPLLTFDLYDDWTEAAQLPADQRLNAITNILKKMKQTHFDNLKCLMQFLAKLAEQCEINKMTPSNLAIVIGPSLLWSKISDGHNMLTTGVQSAITETMISNASTLFGDDSGFGTAPTHVISSQQSVDALSRDVSASKQTVTKVDSSDSLSSDSLGTESVPVVSASNISSSEVSSAPRNVEPEVSNLIPPKRATKKTHAPPPPNQEQATHSEKTAPVPSASVLPKLPPLPLTLEQPTHSEKIVLAASVPTRLPPPPPNQEQATHSDKTVPSASVATKSSPASDEHEESSDSTGHSKVAVTAKVITSAEETELSRKIPSAESSNGPHGDEKTKVPKTKFAANQALISNMLSGGPRKTFLTRPDTTYMDSAKHHLLKTAEEQHEDEKTSQKSESDGMGGKAHESDTKETMSAVTKGTKKESAEPTISEMMAAADLLENIDMEGESKHEPPRKKPERPSKPAARTSGPDADGGNVTKPDSSTKVAENHPSTGHSDVAASQQSSDRPLSAGALVSSATTKSGNSASAEVPNGSQQQTSGGTHRPPKPPPPSVVTSRLPSSSADEDTYL